MADQGGNAGANAGGNAGGGLAGGNAGGGAAGNVPILALDAATLAAISAAVVAGLRAAAPNINLPAPIVNMPARPVKNDVSLPRIYSGGDDFKEFLQEVHLYLASNLTMYPTDFDKVALILGRLQGGRAETWRVQYQASHTGVDGVLNFPTLDIFYDELTATFDDPNLAEKSYRKFEELRQGTSTADEFFSHFDIYRTRAGLTSADVEVVLLNQLKRALNCYAGLLKTKRGADRLRTLDAI